MEHQIHYSKTKPRKCPVCKTSKVVPILYGYPLRKAFEQADQGKIVLGGCESDDHNPSWQCTACGTQIHQEK